jgi:hypothetical protein
MFMATAPPAAAMVGVELDPTAAAICAATHPDAEIHACGFQDYHPPAGSFDAAVGNVPFGDYPVIDRRYHRDGVLSVHNFMLYKSLALVRPGGLVAAVTSRYTLDAADTRQRQRLAAIGDLVAAVRLPDTAFADWAGTSVVTDIVVLRRRGPDEPAGDRTWIDTVDVDIDGHTVAVNAWIAAHPEMVLGHPSMRGRMFAGPTVTWSAPPDRLSDDLDRAITTAATLLTAPSITPLFSPPQDRRVAEVAVDAGLTAGKEGSLHRSGAGFVQIVDGQLTPFTPTPKSQAGELGAAIDLRDALTELLAAEAAGADDDVCDPLRARLNDAYDHYLITAGGPINRYRWVASGRADSDGTRVQRRSYPAIGGFRGHDPDYPSLLALEDFDDDTPRPPPKRRSSTAGSSANGHR